MAPEALPLFVIDASVVVHWYLPEQQFAEATDKFYQDFAEGRLRLAAPGHLWYEVPSALVKAVGAGRLPRQAALELGARFLGLGIGVVHTPWLIQLGMEITTRLGCSLYDGTYLALADILECPTLSADNRLRRTLHGKPSRALWIEDYQTDE